ncbi:MAG: hypothetical protein SFZ03_09220 [Candidatus Melainabacteria bacterium]|nr:hypothetical protein [Candidatus Melainabacteria bacterium]
MAENWLTPALMLGTQLLLNPSDGASSLPGNGNQLSQVLSLLTGGQPSAARANQSYLPQGLGQSFTQASPALQQNVQAAMTNALGNSGEWAQYLPLLLSLFQSSGSNGGFSPTVLLSLLPLLLNNRSATQPSRQENQPASTPETPAETAPPTVSVPAEAPTPTAQAPATEVAAVETSGNRRNPQILMQPEDPSLQVPAQDREGLTSPEAPSLQTPTQGQDPLTSVPVPGVQVPGNGRAPLVQPQAPGIETPQTQAPISAIAPSTQVRSYAGMTPAQQQWMQEQERLLQQETLQTRRSSGYGQSMGGSS